MRKNIPFIIYLLLALSLFLGNNEQRIKKANFLSQTLYYPFISSINKIESLFKIKEQNIILSQQLAQHTIMITALENKLSEIRSTQIKYDTGDSDFVLADIIGYEGSFIERNFIINKGKVNKIKIEYPVISNEGIVGKVISVSQNYSVVLPMNHSTFRLGIMLKRNHLQGMMESDIYGNSYMTLIKLGSDVILGDTIVTSNISTVFPKGYPVGVVTKLIEVPDKVYMNAKILSFANPGSLDQVIVLLYEKDKSYETELEENNRKK